MSQIVRRLFGEKPDQASGATATVAPPPAGSDPTVERLQPYLGKGSETMVRKSDSPSGEEKQRETAASESYQHLGERVAAILNAAQEAAEDIRRIAEEDADRTLRDAQQRAVAHTEDAKRRLDNERSALEELRAELDRRSKELHEDLEAYRQQKHREADAEAAEIRLAAEQAAKAMQGNALLLQRWLEGTIPRFHEVTDWLERVLESAPKSGETETAEQPQEEIFEQEDWAKSR
jgi:Skp family chaperone for outer membrane proteins